MQIDAEIHFWKYGKTIRHPMVLDHKILKQDYLPEQISLSLSRNSIDACIAVSSETADVETRFLAELANTHPVIRGVVGWLDLFDDKAVEKIREFHQYRSIRGYQTEAGRIQNLSSGTMDVLLEYEYVLELSYEGKTDPAALAGWLSAHTDQQFILQHCGNPDTGKTPATKWESDIRTIAKNKNIHCKVSGLLTGGIEKSWKPADLYPFLKILFDAFGIDRLMFASDWPFLLISGMYVQWKSLLEKFTEEYPEEDRDKFFGGNARRLYRI
jgi:L-fuconolactonase